MIFMLCGILHFYRCYDFWIHRQNHRHDFKPHHRRPTHHRFCHLVEEEEEKEEVELK